MPFTLLIPIGLMFAFSAVLQLGESLGWPDGVQIAITAVAAAVCLGLGALRLRWDLRESRARRQHDRPDAGDRRRAPV